MPSVSTSVTSVTQCTSVSVGLVMLEMDSCVERTLTWTGGPIKTLCVALMPLITARRFVLDCLCKSVGTMSIAKLFYLELFWDVLGQLPKPSKLGTRRFRSRRPGRRLWQRWRQRWNSWWEGTFKKKKKTFYCVYISCVQSTDNRSLNHDRTTAPYFTIPASLILTRTKLATVVTTVRTNTTQHKSTQTTMEKEMPVQLTLTEMVKQPRHK